MLYKKNKKKKKKGQTFMVDKNSVDLTAIPSACSHVLINALNSHFVYFYNS